MSVLNINDFLTSGAFLQVEEDLFKVLIGPFESYDLSEKAFLGQPTLLYKPNFWDFLNKDPKVSPKSVYACAKSFLLKREEFIGFLSNAPAHKPEYKWEYKWEIVDESQFREQFNWSKRRFCEQKLVKTVPIICQQAKLEFTAENQLSCIFNLIQNKTFGWSYGFFEDGAGYIGHSPEILVKWEQKDQILHTVALAGTYPKDGVVNQVNSQKDKKNHLKILEDKKIRQEHQIVIEDIMNKLNKMISATAVVKQGETEVLELKYLLHLITKFQIKTEKIEDVLEIIDFLHPTAAMGLYPFDLTMYKEFSEFDIQSSRSSFAAPFAIIEQNQVFCIVAIRNILFTKNRVQIFSGCGITNDSDYDLELAELDSKRESVKKMLGL